MGIANGQRDAELRTHSIIKPFRPTYVQLRVLLHLVDCRSFLSPQLFQLCRVFLLEDLQLLQLNGQFLVFLQQAMLRRQIILLEVDVLQIHSLKRHLLNRISYLVLQLINIYGQSEQILDKEAPLITINPLVFSAAICCGNVSKKDDIVSSRFFNSLYLMCRSEFPSSRSCSM